MSNGNHTASPPLTHPHFDTPGQTPPPPRQTPPTQCMLGYGQQASGTHPTGMQSCSYYHMQMKFGAR